MADAALNGFDWSAFWQETAGYPWKVELLAERAGVDGDWLWEWLNEEVERRRAWPTPGQNGAGIRSTEPCAIPAQDPRLKPAWLSAFVLVCDRASSPLD